MKPSSIRRARRTHPGRMSPRACLLLVLAALLLCGAAGAQAAVRAWLQPERIALGDTTTLNVEVDALFASEPDYGPLERDFELRGRSRSSQTTFVNGQGGTKTTFSVVLEPRTTGSLTVPPIKVGDAQTEALTLVVTASTPGSAQAGDAVFLESEVDAPSPYVQQAVTYTVRLSFAQPLMDGSLDVPPPPGHTLQSLGPDTQSRRVLEGRPYDVIERRYLLVPERSGTLELPAPRFRGHVRGDGYQTFFSGGAAVSTVGKPLALTVRAQPADAPDPWLVARELTLAHAPLQGPVKAGESVLLALTLTADGATGSQLPELSLPPIAGAQVFPEPPQSKDGAQGGRLSATATRRFAIVPAQAGTLRIPEQRIAYWNSTSDRPDVAVLPAIEWEVLPGTASLVPAPAPPEPPASTATASSGATTDRPAGMAGDAEGRDAATDLALRNWRLATIALFVALLLALAWGWRRGVAVKAAVGQGSGSATADAGASVSLRRALAGGDLAQIARALASEGGSPSAGLGAYAAGLADPAQRDAVHALERALWSASDVDRATVLATLRTAFQQGPTRAATGPRAATSPLPPLYPDRR